MITLDKGQLIIIIFLILSIFVFIITFIKESLEEKLEDEKDKFVKKEIDEFAKNKDYVNKQIEKQKVYWEVYYKKQFEWWKHDYLAKKLDRISIRMTGNETMTIDYVDIKLQDNFLAIRDKDLNQILINKDFIREVRYYDSGNTRGSSEDDKG